MTEKSAKKLGYTIVILFVCNILYFYFPFPPAIWRSAILILDCYIILKYIRCGFTSTEKAIMSFVILVSLYFFVGCLKYNFPFTNMGNMYVGLLAFPAFSVLARKGAFDNTFFRNIILLITIACIPYYIHAKSLVFLLYEEQGIEVESVTVNGSVVFAMLTPAILLIKKQKFALAVAGICVFFLLAGSKRGNILASIIPLLLFFWKSFQQNRRSFWKLLLMLVVIGAAGHWIFDLILDNDYLQARFDQTMKGNSSHRDVIYSTMWNLWAHKSTDIEMLFGFGYNGSLLYSGIGYFAHNDWLEILVDFGVFGLLFYLNIFKCLFRFSIDNKISTYRYALFSILSVWLIKATFSMGFNEETMFILSLPFAYVVGKDYLHKKLFITQK